MFTYHGGSCLVKVVLLFSRLTSLRPEQLVLPLTSQWLGVYTRKTKQLLEFQSVLFLKV